MGLKLLHDLRSYYLGSRGRDQREFYDLESRLPYFDHVNRILCRHKRRVILDFLRAPLREGDPILDVGCGIGTFARVLAARGERVVGIDISPRKIARARARGRAPASRLRARAGGVEYHVGDLGELGSGGGLDRALSAAGHTRFSRIIAADVIEHVPSPPAETTRKLRALLPPGGQLIASVPSRLCLGDPGHIWRLLPREWEEVFREVGFEIRRRRMSRICWYRLRTPLALAMVFDLRNGEAA